VIYDFHTVSQTVSPQVKNISQNIRFVCVCVCVVLDDSDTLSCVFVLFVQDDRPLLDFLQLLVPSFPSRKDSASVTKCGSHKSFASVLYICV
jgi:hypothetical protein